MKDLARRINFMDCNVKFYTDFLYRLPSQYRWSFETYRNEVFDYHYKLIYQHPDESDCVRVHYYTTIKNYKLDISDQTKYKVYISDDLIYKKKPDCVQGITAFPVKIPKLDIYYTKMNPILYEYQNTHFPQLYKVILEGSLHPIELSSIIKHRADNDVDIENFIE